MILKVLFVGAVISLCYFCNWYIPHLFSASQWKNLPLVAPDTHKALSKELPWLKFRGRWRGAASSGEAVIWPKCAAL